MTDHEVYLRARLADEEKPLTQTSRLSSMRTPTWTTYSVEPSKPAASRVNKSGTRCTRPTCARRAV